MAKNFLFLVLLSMTSGSYAQGLKVLITEKKNGKRVVLMAENKTADTLNVFLMVNATGYRKSASKPVIKDIAPGKKVPMITLIEILDQESKYTYDLIINNHQKEVAMSQDDQAKDIEKTLENRIVLFSTENCEKCDQLSQALTNKGIEHRVFEINKNPVIYRQFMVYIEQQLTEDTKIRFPLIWNKTKVIFGFEDMSVVVAKLIEY